MGIEGNAIGRRNTSQVGQHSPGCIAGSGMGTGGAADSNTLVGTLQNFKIETQTGSILRVIHFFHTTKTSLINACGAFIRFNYKIHKTNYSLKLK